MRQYVILTLNLIFLYILVSAVTEYFILQTNSLHPIFTEYLQNTFRGSQNMHSYSFHRSNFYTCTDMLTHSHPCTDTVIYLSHSCNHNLYFSLTQLYTVTNEETYRYSHYNTHINSHMPSHAFSSIFSCNPNFFIIIIDIIFDNYIWLFLNLIFCKFLNCFIY